MSGWVRECDREADDERLATDVWRRVLCQEDEKIYLKGTKYRGWYSTEQIISLLKQETALAETSESL